MRKSSADSGSTPDTDAQKAVDGNTDGNYYNGSVMKTTYSQTPWWQVDMGGLQWIDAIQVFNRSDLSAELLKNWYVFVTEEDHFNSNNQVTC